DAYERDLEDIKGDTSGHFRKSLHQAIEGDTSGHFLK
uniref:F-actin binding PROTEIN=ANNEXIN VI homolog (Fragments) n=1 Tax=Bos taurus TaxID=9913 RepID=Q9TSA3_BOVIN